jgi:hypothetical protein
MNTINLMTLSLILVNHKLVISFVIGSIGDKFYIILSGAVSVQIPIKWKKNNNDLSTNNQINETPTNNVSCP